MSGQTDAMIRQTSTTDGQRTGQTSTKSGQMSITSE